MSNKRIINLETGEDVIVPLTPEEEADALARTAAERPGVLRVLAKEAQQAADAVERSDAKNVAALKYLVEHTNAEIRTFVQSDIDVASVTDLASAKACLNRIENRLEDLAVGLAVLIRRELREEVKP